MTGSRARRLAARRAARRRAAGRHAMVVAASVVVTVGAVAGLLAASGERPRPDEAGPAEVTGTPRVERHPVSSAPGPAPSRSAVMPSASASPSSRPTPGRTVTPTPVPPPSSPPATEPRTTPAASRLYRHPESQVLDWVRDNPGDPRADLIESAIAARPAAVWFTGDTPDTLTGRVREVTSGAAAQNRVPVLVPYAVPNRDCGGHSQGGAPDLAAYDDWIDAFAAGLGDAEVIVILEPDSIAQSDCLSEDERADRFASLARAGRVLKAADPRARVYYDAGHSGWRAPADQAALLRQAGAASPESSDGIFSNVSNFHRTADEIGYARQVLDALGGPDGLGAVIDTSRNGNGAPADGEWCDPAGRRIGTAPTLSTGEARVDAYLWVKLPGESDGCKGTPGTFTPSYAYDLARGV